MLRAIAQFTSLPDSRQRKTKQLETKEGINVLTSNNNFCGKPGN